MRFIVHFFNAANELLEDLTVRASHRCIAEVLRDRTLERHASRIAYATVLTP